MTQVGDLARKHRTVVLSALTSLNKGDARPRTLHRLRTHLRRLQAYSELVGEQANARIMAECVSHFSPLRTLDVLEAYLMKHCAPISDLKKVRKRIRAKRTKLHRNQVYAEVRRLVTQHALPPVPGAENWLNTRMLELRELNSRALRDLAVHASEDTSRKTLHELRLTLKSVRYQEEWVVREPLGCPEFVAWLKEAQRILGEFEELGQFRKLARKWKLDSREEIERNYSRARLRAQTLPAELLERLPITADRRLRLVKSDRLEGRLPA